MVERDACINQVLGERMAKGVSGAVLQTSLICVLPHQVVYASLVERPSLSYEEWTFGLLASGFTGIT